MDWQLTCRVCLETGDMVSLFDWDENNDQLSDKYTACCGVEVTKNDSLPTLICLNCVDRLTYAYEFKKQCLSSNETLKECLDEFLKTSSLTSTGDNDSITKSETETITVKQQNGMLLQYELPVEHEPSIQWTRRLVRNDNNAVVFKAPEAKKRGRPRKYPNPHGAIEVSPYHRKKPKEEVREPESLTSLIASGTLEIKQEPDSDETLFQFEEMAEDSDPDFVPGEEEADDVPLQQNTPKKRGRPRKIRPPAVDVKIEEETEDMLLKETIMAFSEPIHDDALNPKPKPKKKKIQQKKKKYVYSKTHVCETCGASFTSNASLQAHIRRHLGIKPFVCSICGYACVMNMELRRHMFRHTGVRPYKCRVCDRRFGDFGSRQKHERLHMGIRPYQCSLCGKSFTYSYVLANHMLTHTGEKKYSCEPCNKKFTKAHHLKYHNKVHHKELYIQQQLEQEAKKMRQRINISNLSGVISGEIVDGTLQLTHITDDGEHESQMEVVEQDDEQNETDRAVADMQAVVLDSEFAGDDDHKTRIISHSEI
ncbi:zinc finger protein 771 isoform X1 [Pieris rapae]|uniref:zinc finger protein 771 isoform X1 n=1 Tax=Pieris rapae TaxID=64459 RepID=UPI000B92D59F|nr:zinc finger protein 771 isoform X1 [Pieris rapae]